MTFEHTYQIETAPEPPMDWETYERTVEEEWFELLGTAPSETIVQEFLQQHPCMVPGAFNLLGNESGHYPWHCGLICQPPLPSYDRRIPDFMWLSTNSEVVEPVLIEIEAPTKRWFTQKGDPTSDLSHALAQISEWKAWFGVPHNVAAFKELYRLTDYHASRRRFRPSYLLIYGRRAEANANPSLISKRSYLSDDDVVTMTYDRLHANPLTAQLISMKVDVDGDFTAVAVPPTITWRPGLAEARALLGGLDDAIRANESISPTRKDFLIQRLHYWNNWASTTERGWIDTGDEE